jgi:phospholipid/cholesterol/gamma-HCH transport system substrate-binding protein
MSWVRTHLIATVLGLALAALPAWLLLRPGAHPYSVQIQFADASGLRQYGDVEMHGTRVGEISALTVSAQNTAVATVRLSGAAAPLRRGATATIRPTGLVGDSYIDLTRGPGGPLRAGATIPLADTGESVGVDQILNVLDPGTRARLRILINEAGVGLLGQGSNLNQLLAALPNSLSASGALLGQIRSADTQLQDLIIRGDRVLAQLAPVRDPLARLVDGARSALGAAAARHTQLAETVAGAPAALAQLKQTLSDLGSTAAQLQPAARSLSATAGPLAGTLRELPGLASNSRGALATAASVAPTLGLLGRRATAPVEGLARTAPQLAAFARALQPLLGLMDAGGTTQLFNFIDGWAQAMTTSDSVGRVFRLDLSLAPSLVNLAVGKLAGSEPSRVSASLQPTSQSHGRPAVQPARARPRTTATGSEPPTTAPPPAPLNQSLSSLLGYLLGR